MKTLWIAIAFALSWTAAVQAREGQAVFPKRVQVLVDVPARDFDPDSAKDMPNVPVKMEFRLTHEGVLTVKAYLSGGDRFVESNLIKKSSREQPQVIDPPGKAPRITDLFQVEGHIFAAVEAYRLRDYWIGIFNPQKKVTLVELVPRMGPAPSDAKILLKTLPWPVLGAISEVILSVYAPHLYGTATIGGLVTALFALNSNCLDEIQACQAQVDRKKLRSLRWKDQVVEVDYFLQNEAGVTQDALIKTGNQRPSLLLSELLKSPDCAERLVHPEGLSLRE